MLGESTFILCVVKFNILKLLDESYEMRANGNNKTRIFTHPRTMAENELVI